MLCGDLNDLEYNKAQKFDENCVRKHKSFEPLALKDAATLVKCLKYLF